MRRRPLLRWTTSNERAHCPSFTQRGSPDMHAKVPVLVALRSHRQAVESRGSLPPRDARNRTRSRLHRLSAATALLVAIVLSAPGCSDDEKITPPTPEDPRKTIPGVLQELLAAYTAGDIHRYATLFDQADFMFVFDPMDVQNDQDIPPTWTWPEELNSATNLFEAELVESIQVSYVVGTPVLPSKEDAGQRPFPEGTVKVIASAVRVGIDTRDPLGGENIIYMVTGDQATFFLRPDTTEIVDGVPVWKIFEWRDKRLGSLATIESTWGLIKANYQ
jgi:hypothetical protein